MPGYFSSDGDKEDCRLTRNDCCSHMLFNITSSSTFCCHTQRRYYWWGEKNKWTVLQYFLDWACLFTLGKAPWPSFWPQRVASVPYPFQRMMSLVMKTAVRPWSWQCCKAGLHLGRSGVFMASISKCCLESLPCFFEFSILSIVLS